MMENVSTRVVAVDDHPVVVEGVMALVTREAPEVELVGSAEHWDGLLTLLNSLTSRPDLALVDLQLNDGTDPADNISHLIDLGINVVVLTSDVRPVPVRRAMRAGSLGLALKADPVARGIKVIKAAAAGEFAVSSDLAFVLITDTELAPKLAPREVEVLSLLADGVSRKQIGARMDPPVALATVVTYLNRAFARYRELGREVGSPSDVVRAAMEDGFLPFRGTGRPESSPREGEATSPA